MTAKTRRTSSIAIVDVSGQEKCLVFYFLTLNWCRANNYLVSGSTGPDVIWHIAWKTWGWNLQAEEVDSPSCEEVDSIFF